ncbi:unnamed protein product [Periconia digitata]|uniref:Uncharacterized protein n=1 Tax=Periconia digitata TaxID=1303443 RepID=A0A9W4XHW8_9PLEO|nr:unnamed protein product [Periconia digitata]
MLFHDNRLQSIEDLNSLKPVTELAVRPPMINSYSCPLFKSLDKCRSRNLSRGGSYHAPSDMPPSDTSNATVAQLNT